MCCLIECYVFGAVSEILLAAEKEKGNTILFSKNKKTWG